MTSPVQSVNVDHVNRLMEAVRIGGELDMEEFLRVASDIGGYVPGTDSRLPVSRGSIYWPSWRQFAKVSRWIGISGSGTIRSGTGRLSACR